MTQIPKAANGFIATLNQMGYMTDHLDPYSLDFIEWGLKSGGPTLDVGSAYGIATAPLLDSLGEVWVNDLDERHLHLFAEQATSKKFKNNLRLIPGDIRLLDLPENYFSAMLAARVIHFFSGSEIESTLRKLAASLKKGGKLFITAETPYLKSYRLFTPVYEERKKSGDRWPGFIADVKKYAPERASQLPGSIHFLDPDVLRLAALQAGLRVERCDFFPRPHFPEDLRLDGRESVGLVAVKN